MFYALDAALGEEGFNALMRDLFQEHREEGWTFEGLAEELKTRTQQDFDGFVQDWVYTTGWYEKLQAGIPPHEIGLQR